ncbi:protein tilB homolog isoform X2 [Ruditapes philippinarum]|uniref:protein tilB homolog isoform X2 n=1 Tax=Ruditapes philippinarum TaxID=129788 RepID=UPI00295AE1C3|nr:protein tilB homolog isoform X2 [Ruditapes philippinarum]
MSESITDSGHDTNSTFGTSHTNTSEITGTLGKINTNNKHFSYNYDDTLPKLPSHKFRYSVWHDLRQTCLTGDQLHAPRVRAGPPEKEKQFNRVIEDGLPIHHDLSGRRRQNHMNELENWESAEVINLCYQELCHEYQWKNFYRILAKCQSAVTINISYNTIVSLKQIKFSRCEYINMHANYIGSIKDFPSLPKAKKIVATDNNIKTLDGLQSLRGTPLEELYLSGNNCSFEINYRQKVFQTLPNLRILDGVARLPSDSEFVEDETQPDNSRCTIL